MKKVLITAETTIDLSKEMLDKYEIRCVPFTLVMGEEEKLDGVATSQELFDYVKKTGKLPRTSAVNQFQYEEFFSEVLKDCDEIIHISLSSEISSAYANAVASLEGKDYKDRVHILDSRTLSSGIALEAIYAKKLADKGVEPKEIINRIQKRIPHAQTSFIIQQLDYLYKGGRCSMLSVFGANLLKIKPQIIVSDGKMVAGKKYRGPVEKTILEYVHDTLETYNNPDLEEVFLTYTTAKPELLEKIKEILKERGFKNINLATAGGTISCHCGPDTLGILYFNDGKH